MARELGVAVFGTSARYLASLEKAGHRPGLEAPLPALRTVLSTGSPLSPESFEFVYRSIGADLHLASISGGTDILSCFVMGNPLLPVHRGELQSPGLGMAVKVLGDQGRALVRGRGELVCTQPFPSQPLEFWGDASGERLHRAYFERFPGIWTHGDFAELTEGGMIIHGRSDAVLNPGGVRIGTAEIYRQVEQLPEIVEAIAVAQSWRGDERVLLFVVLRDGLALGEALRARIRQVIREHTTPRHVPAKILQVSELPRTRSGKLVELAVRATVRGEPIANIEAIANPLSLSEFGDRPELRED
jgi:acetoacetyl-CoA synthetase